MDGKEVVIIPDDERITNNIATEYEISNAITRRIPMLIANSTVFVDDDFVAVPIDELSQAKQDKISQNDIIKRNGNEYVRLTNSADIARFEINKKRSPLSVMRIISEDYVNKKIYVEIISVNDLVIPPLSYLDNIGN